MNSIFRIRDEGILYIPRFVKQVSNMEYGSVVSHEDYNEKLNLNTDQGDYNTEILRLLFTDENPANVPHIKYLDKIIEDEVTRIDGVLDDHEHRIQTNTNNISELSESVLGLLNGTTAVARALVADKINGIDEAGNLKYYGTNAGGTAGFHDLPDSLYADETLGAITVDGVYIVPRPDSVAEAMLTPALRDKINRETISNYNVLDGKPIINGYTLQGTMSLADLGIQPAGSYLTEVPSNYATKNYVDTALTNYTDTTALENTYATITTTDDLSRDLNALSLTVTNNAEYAEGRYARVCINNFTGTPKVGDMLVTL